MAASAIVCVGDDTYQDVKTKFIKAAQNMDLVPNECIVVEDAVTGIVAAHEAGIGKIYALGPKTKHSLLKKILGVNEVIANLGEIPHNVFNV